MSNVTMKALVRKLDAGNWPDYVAVKALNALVSRHRYDEEKRCAAEVAFHMPAFRAEAAKEQAQRWFTLSGDVKQRIGGRVVLAALPAVVQQVRSMCREVLDIADRPARPADPEPAPQVPTPLRSAVGAAEEQARKRAADPEWDPGSYSR